MVAEPPEPSLAWYAVLGRVLWIAIRIMLAIWLAQPGAHFVYQGF